MSVSRQYRRMISIILNKRGIFKVGDKWEIHYFDELLDTILKVNDNYAFQAWRNELFKKNFNICIFRNIKPHLSQKSKGIISFKWNNI